MHSVTFTYFFKDGKSQRKNVSETFVNFDICNQTVSFRKLCFVTLTWFLKANNLKFVYLWNGKSWRKNVLDILVDFDNFHRIVRTVRTNAKMCERHLYTLTFAIELCNCENALREIDLLFYVKNYNNIYLWNGMRYRKQNYWKYL